MKQGDEDAQLHPRRLANSDKKFDAVGGKDERAIQRKAWDAGWWPERKRSGILWMSPDERAQVMVHGTASDHRAIRNLTGEFRKAGLKGI